MTNNVMDIINSSDIVLLLYGVLLAYIGDVIYALTTLILEYAFKLRNERKQK